MSVIQPSPKPRPRQFFGEVGIIVVGVLLALAAQEAVQAFHWKSELAEARESLNEQLHESFFASAERIVTDACNQRQLDWLDAAVAGDPPPINRIDVGSLRVWSTSAWDAAVSSGAVAHMPPQERNRYAGLFAFTSVLGEMNRREFEIATGLDTLIRHPQLTDVSRDRLAQQIAQLKGINRMLTLGSGQWVENAKELGLTLPADAKANLAKPRPCPMPDAPADTQS